MTETSASGCGVLLVGHGTIADERDLPKFLLAIRRGRSPTPELVAELAHRYRVIGGSPLLGITERLAAALERRSGLPVAIGMRFWHPYIAAALEGAAARGLKRLCILPLAPFSVRVYAEECLRVQKELSPAARALELLDCGPWGAHPTLVDAQRGAIERALTSGAAPAARGIVLLTAHSLPLRVIQAGDRYAVEVGECAARIGSKLEMPWRLAYQSQGASAEPWLGPTVEEVLAQAAADGFERAIVAPIGFLSDHVETLYDLDVEARNQAQALGLNFTRVPALNVAAELVECLTDLAERTLSLNQGAP